VDAAWQARRILRPEALRDVIDVIGVSYARKYGNIEPGEACGPSAMPLGNRGSNFGRRIEVRHRRRPGMVARRSQTGFATARHAAAALADEEIDGARERQVAQHPDDLRLGNWAATSIRQIAILRFEWLPRKKPAQWSSRGRARGQGMMNAGSPSRSSGHHQGESRRAGTCSNQWLITQTA